MAIIYSDREQGERDALLQLRSFIIDQSLKLKGKRLTDEIDAYCAQRLHDMAMDRIARDDDRRRADEARRFKHGVIEETATYSADTVRLLRRKLERQFCDDLEIIAGRKPHG